MGEWEIIIFIILVLVILFVVFKLIYNNKIFSPSSKVNNLDGKKYQDLYLGIKTGYVGTTKTSSDENINVWFFNNYPKNKVVLFFHGNSGNISNRSYVIDICEKFKLNLLLVDYRGYGNSDGQPKLSQLSQDGEVAYKFLVEKEKVKKEDIIIWGESLGGSVAIYTASKYNARCLVLLSTFSSLGDVINDHKTVGEAAKMAVNGFIKISGSELDSKEWIKNVVCPVLMMHSKEDKLISFKSAKTLFNNIPGRHKKLIEIKGDHSKPQITDQQLKELFDFIGMKEDYRDFGEIAKNLENVAQNHNWA